MGIDVDSRIFGLLQQQFQVMEIMSADNDKRAFFDSKGDFCGNRVAIGFSVGGIQQFHAPVIDFAGF